MTTETNARVTIRLPADLVKRIDEKRGKMSRNQFISMTLAGSIDSDEFRASMERCVIGALQRMLDSDS